MAKVPVLKTQKKVIRNDVTKISWNLNSMKFTITWGPSLQYACVGTMGIIFFSI